MHRSSRGRFRQFVAWNPLTVVFLPIPFSSFLFFCLFLCCLMLLLSLLAAVINISLFFLMWSLSPRIDTSTLSSMLASPISTFLGTNSLSLSSHGCKVLFIVTRFFVFWSICLISSFVYFNYYLTSCLSLSSLLVWWCPLPISSSTCKFPILPAFWFFLDLVVLFLLSIIIFRFQYSLVLVIFLFSYWSDSFLIWQFYSFRYFSIFTFHYENGTLFFFQIPFLYPDCIFLLFVSVSPVLFLFFTNSLTSSIYKKVIILILRFSKIVASSVFPKYVIEWHHCYCKK